MNMQLVTLNTQYISVANYQIYICLLLLQRFPSTVFICTDWLVEYFMQKLMNY